jgi:ferric-dicitrate binding protein FerR (iron transport regulator)
MSEAPEDRLADLLVDSIAGRLTEARRQELWDWAQANPLVWRLIKDLRNPEYVRREWATWKRIDPQKAYRRWRRRRLIKKVQYSALTVPLLFAALVWWQTKKPFPAPNNSTALIVRSFEEKPLSIEGKNDSTEVHFLPDGTKVWLNSRSTLYYPARFTGAERQVELSGEAYFEPSHGQTPFIVMAGGTQVEVLGTHFNVTDYETEDSIAVTLIAGKVKVRKGKDSVVLTPGQQVVVARNAVGLSAPREVDGVEVAEWKDNRFYFPPHSSARSVLQRIARWYDLKLEIRGDIPDQLEYDGDMQRSLKLDQVLRLIPFQGINYKLDGRRLIVEPKIPG